MSQEDRNRQQAPVAAADSEIKLTFHDPTPEALAIPGYDQARRLAERIVACKADFNLQAVNRYRRMRLSVVHDAAGSFFEFEFDRRADGEGEDKVDRVRVPVGAVAEFGSDAKSILERVERALFEQHGRGKLVEAVRALDIDEK